MANVTLLKGAALPHVEGLITAEKNRAENAEAALQSSKASKDLATITAPGLMSGADKTALNGLVADKDKAALKAGGNAFTGDQSIAGNVSTTGNMTVSGTLTGKAPGGDASKTLRGDGTWMDDGVAAVWSDVTASRAVDVWYTNTTGIPLEVSILCDAGSSTSTAAMLSVRRDVSSPEMVVAQTNIGRATNYTVVPAGWQYKQTVRRSSWLERR